MNVEDFDAEQTVSIELRGIGGHGGSNFAFRSDGPVGLKTDEVGDGLTELQIGEEMDATVASAESGGGKKKEAGSSM